jgi:hypothetical protein
MSEKGTPHEAWYEGRRYVSVAGLKGLLGLSRSKVLRLEAKGAIAKPAAIPRGAKGTRWYLREDIEALAATLEQGGEVDWSRLGGEEGERRPWADFARPGRRRARPQVDVGDEDGEWMPPAVRAAAPKVQRCPVCDGELVWEAGRNVNGEGEMVPHCSRHGVVNLNRPEPTEGTCVRCGGEVVWEGDDDAPGGFVPVCAQHGRTQVHPGREDKRQRERSPRWASFPDGAVGERRRPRGLYEGFFPGAIRQVKPLPPPSVEVMLPYEGPTRPG